MTLDGVDLMAVIWCHFSQAVGTTYTMAIDDPNVMWSVDSCRGVQRQHWWFSGPSRPDVNAQL